MFCLFDMDTTFVSMRKQISKTVTVAISLSDVVVGTTNSVVLRKVGGSARKLGLAKRGNVGIPVVKGTGGRMWSIHEGLELLKVKSGNVGGFKIIR